MHRRIFAVLFSIALFVVVLPSAVGAQAATTTLTTQATASASLPDDPISDTATLSGATNDATGTITFKLYGPFTSQDPSTDTCVDSGAGANLVTTLGPVNIGSPNGSGDYVVSSGNYTPTAAGRYQWIASYTSGDTNINANAATACLDANEASVVNQKQPPISTQATSPVTIGNPISDAATLDVPDGTTGNIVFKLYGPFTTAPTATDCTAAKEITAASSSKTVPDDEDPAGSGNYTSDPYTPTAAGIYNWTATFTPDSGQGVDPSGEIGCGEAAEQSVVNGGATTLTLTTQATPSVTLGEPISDTATLSGGDNPTGTITFNVYGPDDEDCSGDPAFTSEVDVNGEGDYSSKEFVPSAAGTYRWTAEYSGDENNDAVTSECDAENEESVVNDGGGGGNNNGNNNRNNNDNNNRRHHHNRNNNRHHHNRNNNNNDNATHRQYTSERTTVEQSVIKKTIPNKGQLANTGGLPLVGVAFLALAFVCVGISILRFAIRRDS